MAVEIGAILEGKVTGITNFGAFVELPDKTTGMVHISEVSSTFIKDIHEKLSEGDVVKVKVLEINEKGKVALSIKKAQPQDCLLYTSDAADDLIGVVLGGRRIIK